MPCFRITSVSFHNCFLELCPTCWGTVFLWPAAKSPSEVVSSTSEAVAFISEVNFPRSYPSSLFSLARVRAYTTCKTPFFAFTAFTEIYNHLSMSGLPVKANFVKEVKANLPLAFTHNLLSFCDLPRWVKV